jgi:MFS family permease
MICSIIMQPSVGYIAAFSWRAPFALYALGLPLSLIGAMGLQNERPTRKRVVAAAPLEPRFRDWFPFRYAVLALVLGISSYLPVIYSPFLMRERGVSSPASISLVLMGISILAAVSSMLYGPARRPLSTNTAFIFSLAWWGVGTLIAALAPGFTGVVIGLFVGYVGFGWFVPNLMTAVGESVTSHQQGRAAGLVRSMHELAAPLCIVLVEPVAKKYGAGSALMISSVIAFGLLAVFTYIVAKRFFPYQRSLPN